MAAQITWIIEWMNCKPQYEQFQDVVITAGWRCNGTQTEGDKTYNATIYSTCSFSPPTEDFTPYDQLTQEQVLGWCWDNGVDKVTTEEAIQRQIDDQINPPVIQPPLPWA